MKLQSVSMFHGLLWLNTLNQGELVAKRTLAKVGRLTRPSFLGFINRDSVKVKNLYKKHSQAIATLCRMILKQKMSD